jgi:hypothetical protein
MKIKGREIKGPMEELIILPRPDEPIVFKARAIMDMSEYEKLNPAPKGKVVKFRSGVTKEDTSSPEYIQAKELHDKTRIAWMVIESLKATDQLEWSTVKYEDPSTWNNWENDFREAGISETEKMRVIEGVMAANGLSEQRIKEARESFLATQVVESKEQ